jgi:hypothetical protein
LLRPPKHPKNETNASGASHKQRGTIKGATRKKSQVAVYNNVLIETPTTGTFIPDGIILARKPRNEAAQNTNNTTAPQ